MSKLILSDAEAQSPLWQKIKAHLEVKLSQYRSKNDSTELGEIDTAIVRGNIKEVKSFLALEKFELPPSIATGDD